MQDTQGYDFGHTTNNTIEDEVRTPVRSYYGISKTRYCRDCGQCVAPKERVEGRIRGSDACGSFIIWVDEIIGQCGHIVENRSH